MAVDDEVAVHGRVITVDVDTVVQVVIIVTMHKISEKRNGNHLSNERRTLHLVVVVIGGARQG